MATKKQATAKKPAAKKQAKKAAPKKVAAKKTTKAEVKVESKPEVKEIKLSGKFPTTQELLKAGVQFGHKTKRLNPKMNDYIFTKRWDIHIIDVAKTSELLEKAMKFLAGAAAEGSVLFVGTKRQGVDIVESEAKRAGAHFIVNRWPGGLLTNFELIKRSIKKLLDLENQFEEGVEGRTKYEISRMKKQWERLARLYSGIKTMQYLPKAVVILDSNFEKVALTEAKRLGIPVVAIVDTNSDPEVVDYPIPGNDDALASIEMFMKLFANAVLEGNDGKGVKHDLKDYNVMEVKIKKKGEEKTASAEEGEVKAEETTQA